ncbi:hypothetical protein R1flu_022579 [Riccia fluitans]|uniref:UDP-N-acetylmuramoyl-L-alanyl-D-glutamate synthetase n=1 Tax=Riccia fluitans TaxID=41844 RepID=A0ABD1XPN8_9MARC
MTNVHAFGNCCIIPDCRHQMPYPTTQSSICHGFHYVRQGAADTKAPTMKGALKSEIWYPDLDWRDCVKLRRKRSEKVAVTRMQSRQDLTGKNVVVVGLGSSGRAAVKLALARGANVVALDSNPNTPPLEVDLHPSDVRRLRTEIGPHSKETLFGASQLVLSPGVSASQPDIAAAIQAGVPTLSELSFAAAALPKSIQVAAVTGTNGKSTVTTFAGQILRQSGVRTFVGGNLGTPLSEAAFQCLSFPANDPPYHAAVVEVSSYQMECAGLFRPKVGMILNLTPDHLERHKTMEIYGKMKCRIFAQMSPTDLAVIPQSDPFLRKLAAESRSKGTRAWLGALPGVQLDSQARRAFVVVPTTGAQAGFFLSSLKAVGLHNAHNAGSAALIALALDFGLTEEAIQAALPSLQPPPHRMEVVHQDEQQILWINDSKATNVDAALVGMKGITGRKAVVLLGGLAKVGSEGKLGFERLAEVLNTHRAVILFGASGEQIEEELRSADITVPCVRARYLKDAVKLARAFVHPGDAVILSPGCASFDEFRNFEHRGLVFSDLAKSTVV